MATPAARAGQVAGGIAFAALLVGLATRSSGGADEALAVAPGSTSTSAAPRSTTTAPLPALAASDALEPGRSAEPAPTSSSSTAAPSTTAAPAPEASAPAAAPSAAAAPAVGPATTAPATTSTTAAVRCPTGGMRTQSSASTSTQDRRSWRVAVSGSTTNATTAAVEVVAVAVVLEHAPVGEPAEESPVPAKVDVALLTPGSSTGFTGEGELHSATEPKVVRTDVDRRWADPALRERCPRP